MDGSARAYYNGAIKLGFQVVSEELLSGFAMMIGKHKYYFSYSSTPLNNETSVFVSSNKYVTNEFLRKENIPVAKSICINVDDFSLNALKNLVKDLNFPLVVKPNEWGAMGKDVVCNIPDMENLYDDVQTLFETNKNIMIEEFHGGLQGYRVLVFNKQILEIVKKYPVILFGDGKHNIEELVAIENKNRLNLPQYVVPIVFDKEIDYGLKEKQLTKKSILRDKEKVAISYTANVSRGGVAKNVPLEICKENKQLVVNVVEILGLRLAGIDIECEDLKKPIVGTRGIIIEVNFNPSLKIHRYGGNLVALKIMRFFIFKHPFIYLWNRCKIIINKLMKHQEVLLISCAVIVYVVSY